MGEILGHDYYIKYLDLDRKRVELLWGDDMEAMVRLALYLTNSMGHVVSWAEVRTKDGTLIRRERAAG